jgi:hypothetical protein
LEQRKRGFRKIPKEKSRIPEKSTFYTKVVPALLIGMALLMIALILIAAGVLTGLVPYQ